MTGAGGMPLRLLSKTRSPGAHRTANVTADCRSCFDGQGASPPGLSKHRRERHGAFAFNLLHIGVDF
ncbi:MAG: hypothetical protein IJI03_21110 [Rudaea sp.]|uniref:hypothetical protein n=1 Tax=unclassified Rudaea TaxID=2627037 RepID=UPI0010F6BBB7|nr:MULTISPECIES: hypothetical protein [unclassified Rudaea]MBR0347756.1 hypothetical protein [Rudaea sp.]